ncbi:hypothetical protein EDD17DRAFT_1781734 [Pisolithus thermaeus]|nr:hypothetical protein EDD17DRAFT_1781734 [Pisolithus thermaeus]
MQSKVKLQQLWQTYEYLIIGEISMLGKTFLACLSRNIAIGKMFPPVAEFQMVVLLQQQMQVTDEVWQEFLHHLCMGPGTSWPDFTRSPWALACLVIPHHAVQQQWNHAALHKHAVMADAVIVKCVAEDTMCGEPLTLAEWYAFAMCGLKTGNQKCISRQEHQTCHGNHELPNTIELCVGCSVMVTENVKTDLDITNGTCRMIVDIFLHPNEPPITCINSVVCLKLLPSFVLRMTRAKVRVVGG